MSTPPALRNCAQRLPPGDRLVSPSPPHSVWRPCNAAEQALPDRPVLHAHFARCAWCTSSQACPCWQAHAGALAARRGSGAQVLIGSVVGRSSVFPLLHRWSRDRSRRGLAVKARRAVSSPAAAGRTHPALVSLTASPRRSGCSRAMNSGKTAARTTSPGHCAEPTKAHTGLRILESGQFWKQQEGRACKLTERESTPDFLHSFSIFFSFNVPKGQELSP